MNGEAATNGEVESGFPAIWRSLGWVALFLALQLVIGSFAFGIALALDGSGQSLGTLMQQPAFKAQPTIWSLIIANLTLLGLLWHYLRKPGRLAAIGLDRWSSISLVKTVVLAVLLIGAGLTVNYFYATYVIPDVKMQEELRKLFAALPQTWPNKILLFTAIALIAPLLEELVFRGLLQKSFARKMPAWAAILAASAIFAAVHMDYNAFPPLLVMGAAFGYLYHKTGSLRVNIAMHIFNNGAALLLS